MGWWRIAGTALLLAGGLAGCMPVQEPDFPEAPTGRLAPVKRDLRPPGDSLYLVLDLGKRRLYVRKEERGRPRQLASYSVAIGRTGYETPTGEFAVREKIIDPDFVVFDWTNPKKVIQRVPPGPDNPLGLRWIGFTSAYGWGIGFHGTPNPELLGQAVSHGCVRMRNSDVLSLYELVRVGTPVIVRQ
jgi:L,D-transpeptidase ErfK/SrfK